MSRENSGDHEMRAEYDIRGGVRGKYLEEYRKAPAITFESEYVVHSTAGVQVVLAGIAPVVTYPTLNPSPEIHVGVTQEAHAG